MAEVLTSPFLDRIFLILLTCVAGNSHTRASENKESTSSIGCSQHPHRQGNNHDVAM